MLCERGLALRGKNETIGSVHNGNFLGLVELLSKYDTFLATHIENYANKGTGHVSYLSHHIYEEIIQIMANKVMSVIISELKVAKYFSISVDSTPDIKHVDQLSFTIRYVLPTGPVERFLSFIPMAGHEGKEIAAIIFSFLEKKEVSISNCRGQSYDNASNMSGNNGQREQCTVDAVKALSSEYRGHIELLTEFSNNTEETLECRRDTSGILVQLKKLDTSIMLVMWDTLLERIQQTSETLQKTGLALNTAVQLLKSLISFYQRYEGTI